MHFQVCGPKGRDCIERNSRNTFNCSSTCKGIYATVQWVPKGIDEDMADETVAKREGGEPSHFEKRLAALEKKLQKMENDRDGKGDEVDAEKYKMLITEYKRFKRRNLQHFKFHDHGGLVNAFGKC